MPPSSLPVLPASLEAFLSSATLSPLVSSFEPFPGLSVVPPTPFSPRRPSSSSPPPPPGSPAPTSPTRSDDTLLESAPTTTADDEEEEEDLEPDDVAEEGRASLKEGGGNVELDDKAASVEREKGTDDVGTTRMGLSREAFGSTRRGEGLVAVKETESDRQAGSPAQALSGAAALRWPDKTPSFVPFGKDDGTVVTPFPPPPKASLDPSPRT